MTTSIEYLEAAKTEEVAAKLRDEGYEVILDPQGTYQGYDLIATKGDKKLAIEVKANTQLRESAEIIKDLYKRATEHGIDEFRLVVVSPPREVRVEIDGLKRELLRCLIEYEKSVNNLSEDSEPFSIQRITEINEIDIDSVGITRNGTRVTGNGVVEVSLHPLSAGDREPLKYSWGLPFNFDVKLGPDLKISEYTFAIEQSVLEE